MLFPNTQTHTLSILGNRTNSRQIPEIRIKQLFVQVSEQK